MDPCLTTRKRNFAMFGFIQLHLETAGLRFDDVVEMTTYHVTLRKHLNAFVKVKDEFVRMPYPAWTIA